MRPATWPRDTMGMAVVSHIVFKVFLTVSDPPGVPVLDRQQVRGSLPEIP